MKNKKEYSKEFKKEVQKFADFAISLNEKEVGKERPKCRKSPKSKK